jgi:hypothetical protein
MIFPKIRLLGWRKGRFEQESLGQPSALRVSL